MKIAQSSCYQIDRTERWALHFEVFATIIFGIDSLATFPE